MKPDFNNCILNVVSSIMNKYEVNSKYITNKIVDEKIKNAKHVFLVVLDGLGRNIIEKHLTTDSFIRSNMKDYITSVYPPTTVAATSAICSGMSPGESGWLGWHQYFDEIRQDVVLFKNITTYTNIPLTINVADTYIHYTPIISKFKNVKTFELYPSFKENGFRTFKAMGKEMVNISKLDEPTYAYCYWNNPDYLMHECGTSSPKVRKVVKQLDKTLAKTFKNVGKDTTIIIMADHGVVDTTDLFLTDYPDLYNTLIRKPSIEARTVAFKVKDHETFKTLFKKYFGNWFKLYETSEFLKEGYLGNEYTKATRFLFDYVAVAIDKYNIALERDEFIMKAHHAGDTVDEMIVPLSIVTK